MPNDTKRITGPEQSITLAAAVGDVAELVIFRERKDGRDESKSRPIFLKCGVTSQARGSAYVEMANTKIICAIYGPRESLRREDFSMSGQLTCDFKFVPFSCPNRRQHQQDSQEREFSDIIVESFQAAVRVERYTKGVIDICVKVLEDDGNVLGAAITCTSAALASAGVEMYDLVIGATVRQHGAITLTDPTYEEENQLKVVDVENDGIMTIGYMMSINQVTAITMTGQVNIDSATTCLKACMEACYQIYPVVQKILLDTVTESNEMDT